MKINDDSKKAYLVLENGKVFEGYSFGAPGPAIGETVFTTGMTGYLETLTDKSYCGQIIVQTFPLIGNYGVIDEDFESSIISAKGYIVRYPCDNPSNFRCAGLLNEFLLKHNIAGLYGIDTRELTKILRNYGTMNGMITDDPAKADLEQIKAYKVSCAVESVSAKEPVVVNPDGKYHVALIDYGYKENIVRALVNRDCKVTVLPYTATAKQIKELGAAGVMLSNGPGDPAENTGAISNLREITKLNIPVFGICLGHQLLALSFGFKTEKLKFGHRGANHPAKDLLSGKTYITSQNHGYAVKNSSIDPDIADLWFINNNDGTCEGIKYKNMPVWSVQFHPEGCGGPQDTAFLFDMFLEEIKKNAAR